MEKYRILKDDEGTFKVQKNYHWFRWSDLGYYTGGNFQARHFEDYKEAEQFIENVKRKDVKPRTESDWKVVK